MTIDSFSAEYHEMKTSSSNGGRRSISLLLAGLNPWPQILAHDEKLAVMYWTRKAYQHLLDTQVAQQKGVTDANMTTVATKKKARRLQKSTETGEEDDLGINGDTHKYIYLEKEDSTQISIEELQALSQKAHVVWEALVHFEIAPSTWGKITSVTWEYYAQSLLNKPGQEFLQLCDDNQWKLQEWMQRNYSPWAKTHGLQGVHLSKKPKKEGKGEDPLDIETLIWMDEDKEGQLEDIDHKEMLTGEDHHGDSNLQGNLGWETYDMGLARASPGENMQSPI